MASIFSSRLVSRTLALRSTTARSFVPLTTLQRSSFNSSSKMAAQGTSSGFPIATLDSSFGAKLPASATILFAKKKEKNLSFETISKALGRDEVACAALFYGQAQANDADITNLSKLLDIPEEVLKQTELQNFPDRGKAADMPPREPLVYRLYEIVQNYGYAYKAVLNEKFGDGIMSAISFSTTVKKETDEKGDWVVITLRGKWLPFSRF